jgi:Flp pilus assembly protein TadD
MTSSRSLVGLAIIVLVGCEAPRPLRKPAAVWEQARLSAMLQLADEQVTGGKFEQARQTLATFHESSDPRLAVALARVDVEEGRYATALERLDAVAPENRSAETCDRLRGVALEGLGRWGEAARAYEAAYHTEPALELLLAWVDTLVLDGRADEARTILADERSRFPGQPVLQVLAARLYARDGELAAAADELTTAGLAEPDSAEIRRRRAEAYTAAGRYTEALPLWRTLVAAAPDDEAVNLGLATAQLGADEPAQSLETTQRVLSRHAESPDARLLAALSYRRLGQHDEATALVSDLRTDDDTARLARALFK